MGCAPGGCRVGSGGVLQVGFPGVDKPAGGLSVIPSPRVAAWSATRGLSDIPCVKLSSSSLLILFVVVSPGGVLVVVRAGFEAAVEDADEAVGELAQRCVVAGASPA